MKNFIRNESGQASTIVGAGFGLVILVGLMFWIGPQYNVWEQTQHGKAELARASSNRMIAVQEAEAKYEAASKLAEAEVIRAKGVAQANQIIGTSLQNNEGYLRYLYIQSLENNQGDRIIYVPTEAGLPILEAGKR